MLIKVSILYIKLTRVFSLQISGIALSEQDIYSKYLVRKLSVYLIFSSQK